MPTMKESPHAAEITWLGCVPESTGGLRAEPREILDLDFGGLAGGRHEGENRPSCSRTTFLYPKGTEIRNVRQLSILSREEMAAIAAELDLETLDPVHLGVSIVLAGIPDFTHVPPSSRLLAPSGASITIDMENRPCVLPGREIEADAPGHGKGFAKAAQGRRGVAAWVERPGRIAIGDRLRLFVPDQRAWRPEAGPE
jgi:hypothetical protein